MVDRQLIKRILGQRNLAQSLIVRHRLGVSDEMPAHPAFVAPLAVVAAPVAQLAPLFEQTPLDDAALASFFAAPDAERAPLPEMRLQPAPVAPTVTDEGAEIGALPAAAPPPPDRLDQQDVWLPRQPQSQTGREVAEQAAPLPGTRAEPRPHVSSERHDTGAAAQAHLPAPVAAETLQPAETPQPAALPQVRPPAQAAPETGSAQQAGTAIPAKIAETLERERPPAPQERLQPAPAAPASGDPYIDMVNKVRAARTPKGPAPRPRVPLGQRLNEARDFDSPVDLNQAVSHAQPEQPGVPVPAQPTPAERGTQPWDDPKQADRSAAQPAPSIHPQAVEQTQPAPPLPRPETGTNAAVPTDAEQVSRAVEPARLPDPAVQAERAAIAQQAEPAPGLAQATAPAAPTVPPRPDASQVAAPEGAPIPAQPVDHAGDVRPVQRQAQAERAQAEQSPLPFRPAVPAPLPNEPRDPSTAQVATPAQPPAFPPVPADLPQPAPQAKPAVAPETGSVAGQPDAPQPQEQSSERLPAAPPISQPDRERAGVPGPIEAQSGQKIDQHGARMPAAQPGTPRTEAPPSEQLDHIDPSQVESGVQPVQERQPASRAGMAASDPDVSGVPIVAPDSYLQQPEQREVPNEPAAQLPAPRGYAPPATPDQPVASAANDQTVAPEQAPVRVPSSDSAVTPAARPELPRRETALPEAAVQPAPAGTPAAWAARLRRHEQAPAPEAPAEPVAGLPQATPNQQQPGSANTQPQASAPPAGTPAAWAARLRRHEQASAPEAPAEPVAGLPQATPNRQQQGSMNMQPQASAPVRPAVDARQAQPQVSAPAAGTAAGWAARLRRHEQANEPEAPVPAEPIAGLPQSTAPEARQAQPQASAPVRTAIDARQAQPEVNAPAAGTAAAWAARLRRHELAPAPEAPVPAEPVAGLPQVAQDQQAVSANTQPQASAPASLAVDARQAQPQVNAPADGTATAWAARLRRHETMQQPQSTDRTALPLAGAPATPAVQLQQNEQGTPMPPPGLITPSGDVGQPMGQPQSPARPQTPIAQAPLRESTRRFLKPIIGRDPADVPVYRGAAADQLAARYAADALTDGAAVVLAADESETTPRALGVLAHELAHVEQAARFVAPHTVTERAALERVARHVETQAVSQARAEREQVWQASPAVPPVAARPVAAVPPARPKAGQPAPSEQWNGLPAPWEPLPDDVFAPQQSAFVPETRATPAAQRSPSPAPVAAHTQAARPGAARPGASPEPMLAEHSRIQPGESATEPAQQDAPPAPEPDLDLLARQVYQVIKQRLAAERRRGRS